MEQFFEKYREIPFKKGEVIIQAEQEPDGIYYVKKGLVRMYSVSSEGKELTLNIYKPGSYFPLTWALGNTPNITYFEAMSDCLVVKAPKYKLIDYIKNNPRQLYDLSKRLSSGLGGISTQMTYLLFGKSFQRVCFVLLTLARRFGKEEKDLIKITIPFTHQQIADYAALARETVSIEIEKLKKKKMIEYRSQKITILNINKLEDLALLKKEEIKPNSIG